MARPGGLFDKAVESVGSQIWTRFEEYSLTLKPSQQMIDAYKPSWSKYYNKDAQRQMDFSDLEDANFEK